MRCNSTAEKCGPLRDESDDKAGRVSWPKLYDGRFCGVCRIRDAGTEFVLSDKEETELEGDLKGDGSGRSA